MNHHAPRPLRHAGGFTLVEMIVAMALLSMVVLTLGASLRGMAGAAERVDARSDRIDEMRVATGFLREVFGGISAQKLQPPAQGLLFAGAPNSVTWAGVMPARFGAAGRHLFRLALEDVQDQRALVLRFIPWNGQEGVEPDWAGATSRVLVGHVDQAAFGYEGAGVNEGWSAQWASAQTRLPRRLRLSLTAAGGDWPPFIVPLIALPGTDAARGRASLGPE